MLNDVEHWFGRFIAVTDDRDLSLITLWTVASHLAFETYTTPRLIIDSATPGSGKTTLLDHIGRLACAPLHAAALSSPALIVRSLQGGIRTLLVDEVDRSLSPTKPGVEDLIAILNSGYRRGATRPVLVPVKGGGWEVKEMPTFCPVAMAGNSPRLPDDTRSRAIRVLLMPDIYNLSEDSDWENIEGAAAELKDRIIAWTDQIRESIIGMPVELPNGCIGRAKEKWRPLKRVAVAAGSHWPEIVDELTVRGMAETEAERDAGLTADTPGIVLLRDLHAIWPTGELFVPTEKVLSKLVAHHPDYWGKGSAYGKQLTAHRLGKMLSQAAKVTSGRIARRGPRGYRKRDLDSVWHRLGIGIPSASGASGASGAPDGFRRSGAFLEQPLTAPLANASGASPGNLETCSDQALYPLAPLAPLAPLVREGPIPECVVCGYAMSFPADQDAGRHASCADDDGPDPGLDATIELFERLGLTRTDG